MVLRSKECANCLDTLIIALPVIKSRAKIHLIDIKVNPEILKP